MPFRWIMHTCVSFFRQPFKIIPRIFIILAILFIYAFIPALYAQSTVDLRSPAVQQALNALHPNALRAHMHFLADDLLEGRQPGTRGYALGAKYVESQFDQLGLTPAGEDSSFIQAVPLRKGQVQSDACSFTITHRGQKRQLAYNKEFIVSPDMLRTENQVSANVAFVGFGITVPELKYDDYAKMDVRGKIVVYLNGAPASFPSDQRAYYSSASKLENAVAHGAVGIITINLPDNRTPWIATVHRARQGAFRWLNNQNEPNNAHPQLGVIATLSAASAEALFAGAPTPPDAVFAAVKSGKLQSFDLPAKVDIRTRTQHTAIPSANVVGVLPGSDPQLKNEYVVYVAHIDHFGIGIPVDGDSIYNGAHDNASGVAILLEAARAFTALPEAPKRSILFLAVTAEEWGLLGSDYFATNPTVPKENLVATIAMDMPFFFLPVLDIVPYGADHSSISQAVRQATAHLNLAISPDPMPEQVLFIRSDHFSFIRQGIPALFVKAGPKTDNPSVDGKKANLDWRANVYHTPKDDLNQSFDYTAGVKHVQLDFLTGYIIASQPERPTWNKGDFFGNKFGNKRAE